MSEVFRRVPCGQCGYELRGRRVGEHCPECGWRIDAAGPAWCTPGDLRTLRQASRLAWIPCAVLLLVPTHFVLSIVGDSPSALGATLIVFVPLMTAQIAAQAVGVWQISSTAVGARRRRRLRAWSAARIVAFALGTLVVVVSVFGWSWLEFAEWFEITAYFTIPLLAIVADAMVARTLASLAKESRLVLPGSYAVLPVAARTALWIAYPMILVPIVGWFFAPILWTVSMAICFWQIGRLSSECEKVFVAGEDGALL